MEKLIEALRTVRTSVDVAVLEAETGDVGAASRALKKAATVLEEALSEMEADAA